MTVVSLHPCGVVDFFSVRDIGFCIMSTRFAWLSGLVLVCSLLVVGASTASATVVARVDLSTQTMKVSVNGRRAYTWRVSTGRGRYRTPVGHYRPYYLKRRHYSRKYRGAPMPYSIFFRGGYAVHGTNHIRALGRRASHGCIRLHPVHAARLYSLVRRHGKKNTRIIIGY
jgi:lipoprotein-anchoring transpeptidase ErfK/SrfK